MKTKLIAVLLAVCLLCGCSLATDTEALLRAPQLSGESRALQKALNSYLNSAVTLKYPNSGDFLSPFAFGDWDGDGQDEAAVLYAADSTGMALQLLTNVDGEFRSAQTLNLGEGVYTGCAALQAGRGIDEHTYLVMDAYSDSGSLVSDIITYDEETGFLQSYHPPGVSSVFNSTRRYDTTLFSCDIDQNGTVDIPVEAEDGGSITSPLDKRLRFVVWQDYAGENGGKSTFGVYDAANRVFFGLPAALRKNVLLRPLGNTGGWQLCNLTGTVTYCELRMVEANAADNEEFTRIANVGSQQLQARVLTSYAGLTEEYIQKHTVLLGAE